VEISIEDLKIIDDFEEVGVDYDRIEVPAINVESSKEIMV
jgi:hypothetical protein